MLTGNEFYSGLNKDIDELKITPSFLRDALNITLIEVSGRGLVASNVAGNEFAFELSAGFVPIGHVVHNGIAYIFSYNQTSNLGEIGTYPSPLSSGNTGTCNDTGFEHAYRALTNFAGPNNPVNAVSPPARESFTTPLFNFDINSQLIVKARDDYDGSVNIYFADGRIPFRVINSGFCRDGKCVHHSRWHWEKSFPNNVNVINESAFYPSVILSSILVGGSHKAGTYFYYLRYTTPDLHSTSFTGESGPIQISPDTIDGVRDITTDGGYGGQLTNKSVVLDLFNLDVSHKYFELAYVYHFDGVFEIRQIDKLFPVTGSFMTVTVSGNEPVINLNIADIQRRKPREDVPLAMTHYENRLWIANLKQSDELLHNDLILFAKGIDIGFDDSLKFADQGFDRGDTVSGNGFGQYKYWLRNNRFTGYFRGETYAFGIVFVFKSGRESSVFPLTGSDRFGNGVPVTSNDKGIFRFPGVGLATNGRSPTIDSDGNLKIMGVTFTVDAGLITVFMNENISGFFFVRAERKPNLIYQGLVTKCLTARGINQDGLQSEVCLSFLNIGCPFNSVLLFVNATSVDKETRESIKKHTDKFIPFLDNNVPYRASTNDVSGSGLAASIEESAEYVSCDKGVISDHRYGMFSPDYLFNKSFDDGEKFIYHFANVKMPPKYLLNSTPQIIFGIFHEFGSGPIEFLDADSDNIRNVPSYRVIEWEPAENSKFVSRFNEGHPSDAATFFYEKTEDGDDFYEHKNRAFASASYIGLNNEDVFEPTDYARISEPNDPRYGLVNIYKANPISADYIIANLYDIKSEKYFKIATEGGLDFFTLANAGVVNGRVFYRGDCFLQRTVLKTLFNPNFYGRDQTTISEQYTQPKTYLTFGAGFSVVTENAYNTAMRRQDNTNKYWPEEVVTDKNEFFVFNSQKESSLINIGYNKVLPDIPYQGIDENLKDILTGACRAGDKFPTRIMFSNFHQIGSLRDFWRTFDLAAFKDYDFRNGEIISLIDHFSKLYSIQRSGINIHYVNERAILQSAGAGELLLGTGDVLEQKTMNISDVYGSGHRFGIVKTEFGIYGVDANKRKIWQIRPDGFDIISDSKFIRRFMHETLEQNKFTDGSDRMDHSDIIHNILDAPVGTEGIVAAYDRKHRDVIFSFIFSKKIIPPAGQQNRVRNTIVFNELLGAFKSRYSYNSPYYITLNEDFFSVDPDDLPSADLATGTGRFFLHDVPVSAGINNYQTFYGALQRSHIEFMVNPTPEMIKIFENILISSSGEPFDSIMYTAEDLIALHFPFLQPLNIHINPIYRENQWRIPVHRTTIPVDQRVRGRAMKIFLEYFSKNPTFVKSVLTHYRTSYQ